MGNYIEHPLIRKNQIEARVYQQVLYAAAIKQNSLIILPTGLGKTVIFIMVIASYLNKYPDKKVIITAPTRPLVDQHYDSCVKMLRVDLEDVIIQSGETSPDNRSDKWQAGKIFIATPQTLRNDIINKRIDLSEISLLCFDEAHRGVGDDPYVLCAQEFAKYSKDGRILGFTASPGKKEKIYEIVENLKLNNLEYMDEDHPQIKPYIHDVAENWIWVDLPSDFEEIIELIENRIKEHLKFLKEIGVTNSYQISSNPKRKILSFPKKLNKIRGSIDDQNFFGGMASYGQLMLLYQASEMLETQGLITLQNYIDDKIDEYKRTNKNSLRRFVQDKAIQEAYNKTKAMLNNGINHPKLQKLMSIVSEQINQTEDSRILIFANYKATTQFLVRELKSIEGIRVHRFVGQSSSSYGKGLTQKQQKDVMDSFRSGDYNVLVSTSVGEEGLDVAQCDLVIFYDVTPSATRLIQRSGRTGRARAGRVVILIAKGTRDEGYFYASRNQQKKIKEAILQIKKDLENQDTRQKGLDSFFSGKKDEKEAVNSDESELPKKSEFDTNETDKTLIFVDHRERGASIMRLLLNEEVEIRQESLPIGDFLLSTRVGVERKTVRDFQQTLIRQELFDQLIKLKSTYEKPILLIEGDDIYSSSINKEAIRGTISSIIVDYSIPILYTKDETDTVKSIVRIAKREQESKERKPRVHSPKPGTSLYDEQIFLLSSLPNIDQKLATRILNHFKNPRRFFSADQDQFKKVYGIGPAIANRIDELLSTNAVTDITEESSAK